MVGGCRVTVWGGLTYLFQITGITDQRSVANFAFGLVDTEKQEGFERLCEQLECFR